MGEITILDALVISAIGFAIVFVVLIILMVVCTLINNHFTKRAAKGREII